MENKKRENPMAVRSKNALSQALLKLMMGKNFDDISISDITDRAYLSRQTFYTNFSKKEEILEYLLTGLFCKYSQQLALVKAAPDNLIIDYFIFWDKNKEFLTLLFNQNMGYLFQEHNRAFFMESTDSINDIFTAEPWQLPYIKASLSGLTYELLYLWVAHDQGLSINILTALANNFISGNIFSSR